MVKSKTHCYGWRQNLAGLCEGVPYCNQSFSWKQTKKIRDTVACGSVLASGAQTPASAGIFLWSESTHFAWNS